MEFNTQNLQSVECDNEQTLCRNTASCINVPAGVSVLNGMYIPGRTIVRRKPGWHTSRLEPQCWHISTPFLSVLSSEIFIQPKHRFSYIEIKLILRNLSCPLFKINFWGFFLIPQHVSNTFCIYCNCVVAHQTRSALISFCSCTTFTLNFVLYFTQPLFSILCVTST